MGYDVEVATLKELRVPPDWNGIVLSSVYMWHTGTPNGTSGVTSVQIERDRGGTVNDLLSTELTIDAGETDSSTAATAAVIDADYKILEAGDILTFKCTAVPGGTVPTGLTIQLGLW
ncbi:MAG: hypothetical protein GF320_14330 [Armatimonadia bacterium]|nr:hypothetical protein [Armatimonadia bacterium]